MGFEGPQLRMCPIASGWPQQQRPGSILWKPSNLPQPGHIEQWPKLASPREVTQKNFMGICFLWKMPFWPLIWVVEEITRKAFLKHRFVMAYICIHIYVYIILVRNTLVYNYVLGTPTCWLPSSTESSFDGAVRASLKHEPKFSEICL